MHPNLSFTEAIREATLQCMELDHRIFILGLGVNYHNGADGTTSGLKAKFPDRIFDTPVSEASLTGTGVGAAICGMKPIIHHGRVEFALFAIDQIITQAAKWNYMFGGGNPVPIVFRIAVGRQWGNGPQHTQALYSLFGAVPGLKVVIPSSPSQAKGLLAAALHDINPIVFLESRWLYSTREDVDPALTLLELGRARVVREGSDATLVAYGDGLVDALKADRHLREQGINIEIVDLVSLQPIDHETIARSVKKTGRIITVDTTQSCFCVGSEIIAKICSSNFGALRSAPVSIACPNIPCPTSTALTEHFYPTRIDIARAVQALVGGSETTFKPLSFDEFHLAPKFDFSKNE
jgi:pyruvate/2-oxoglutarate/acetoin dehydrogenase E1 component